MKRLFPLPGYLKVSDVLRETRTRGEAKIVAAGYGIADHDRARKWATGEKSAPAELDLTRTERHFAAESPATVLAMYSSGITRIFARAMEASGVTVSEQEADQIDCRLLRLHAVRCELRRAGKSDGERFKKICAAIHENTARLCLYEMTRKDKEESGAF